MALDYCGRTGVTEDYEVWACTRERGHEGPHCNPDGCTWTGNGPGATICAVTSTATIDGRSVILICCQVKDHLGPHRSHDHFTWRGEGQTAMRPLDTNDYVFQAEDIHFTEDEGETMKDTIREPMVRRGPNYCEETTVSNKGTTAVCSNLDGHEGPHVTHNGFAWTHRGETARREQDTDNPHTPVRVAVWDNFLRTMGHHPDNVTKVVVEKGHIIVDSTTVHRIEFDD